MQDHANLRLALRLNAGFSSVSALAILTLRTHLAESMGIPAPILLCVALGLLAFAAHLVFTAGRSDVAKLRAEALRHSLSDFAWVVGSIGVFLAGLLTPTGNWILAAVAVPVLALGLAQWRSLPVAESEALAAEA